MPRRAARARRPAGGGLPPLWSTAQLDALASELDELGRSIREADEAAARAGSAEAGLAALNRALYLRRRRLKRAAGMHSMELRRVIGLAARVDAFAASQPGRVIDELASHLSPVPLESFDREGRRDAA